MEVLVEAAQVDLALEQDLMFHLEPHTQLLLVLVGLQIPQVIHKAVTVAILLLAR
jgi:hypothetical protein